MRWRVRSVALVLLMPLATVAAVVSTGSAASAGCATAVVPSDFNGDGFADIAIGAPFYKTGRGGVTVVYGPAIGTPVTQAFDESQFGSITPTGGDYFGDDLATGNFNGDCYADLAIAIPGQPPIDDVRPDTGVSASGGALVVLYGSASGLGSGTVFFMSQLDTNQGIDETGGGETLAAGDFNGDGRDDLAIGLSESANRTGEVAVMKGSSTGLTTSGHKLWTQDSAGVPGTAEVGDFFGEALAAGDFNGDKHADLAISAPGEDTTAAGDTGSVTILPGSSGGLTGSGSKAWTEDSTGVPGTSEDQDFWGTSLAAGDLTGDGRADLVIGDPQEGIGTHDGAGAVTILHGAATGLLTTSHAQLIDQSTAGVPGVAETGDGFGESLAIGYFNSGTRADLAIGDPGEGIGNAKAAGTVTVLSGTSTGVSTSSAKLWDQNTSGIIGTSEHDDWFGTDLTAVRVRGSAETDLVVGVSNESLGSQTGCGAVAIIPGSSSGLTATGNRLLEPTVL
ncbi:MAG TPA: FG-GAP repeat protein, partial [Micromonosporaceae bacterium]